MPIAFKEELILKPLGGIDTSLGAFLFLDLQEHNVDNK